MTLKLKRADFKLLTRRTVLPDATQIADRIYRTARALFDQTDHPKPYRLIGVGLSDLIPAETADRAGDLLDPQAASRVDAERATDAIRERFGDGRDPQGPRAALTRASSALAKILPGVIGRQRRRAQRRPHLRRQRHAPRARDAITRSDHAA